MNIQGKHVTNDLVQMDWTEEKGQGGTTERGKGGEGSWLGQER